MVIFSLSFGFSSLVLFLHSGGLVSRHLSSFEHYILGLNFLYSEVACLVEKSSWEHSDGVDLVS
jgi:hypothetical protein